jgi:chromate reductase
MRILGISGSLRRGSHNRMLLRAAADALPPGVELVEWEGLRGLPAFDEDLEDALPEPVQDFFEAVEDADALLIATPEYNASLPGALKNAIDWASRPWGQNSFHHIPAGVIGASIGPIGTAVGQQSLRAVLSFCNARQMTSPEAYVHYTPDVFADDGEVKDESTAAFLSNYMKEFRDHLVRVLTVLPRA